MTFLLRRINKLFIFTVLIGCLGYAQNIKAAPTITTDSRIKTLVYNENEVYQLTFHYGYQSFIELSDDEEIELISLGESFPWRMTPSGKRLFIRPLEIDSRTNMTIITTKRTYQFEIISKEYSGRADEELIFSIRFFYPENIEEVPNLRKRIGGTLGALSNVQNETIEDNGADRQKEIEKASLGQNITLIDEKPKTLNFKYSMVGNASDIAPVKVYDDGISTYFQFEDNNLIIPTISAVDIKTGMERPLSYKIEGNYVVIDTVEMQFSFRLGNSLLCLFNEGIMN